MKAVAAIGLASAIALTAVSPAAARQGCGPGFHRMPSGMCRPNHEGRMVFVEGRYYPGHGYWYRNRWWHHRYHYRNERRYR